MCNLRGHETLKSTVYFGRWQLVRWKVSDDGRSESETRIGNNAVKVADRASEMQQRRASRKTIKLDHVGSRSIHFESYITR